MITRLVNRFPVLRGVVPTGVFAQRVGALAGGTLAAQVVIVLITPILTRLFSASAFGTYQLYMALLTFVSPAMALRYELAIFIPDDDDGAAHVAIGALCMLPVTGAILSIALATCLANPHWLGQFATLGSTLWWIVISALIIGIYQVLTHWGLRRHEYKTVALSRFAQSFGQMFGQLALGLTRATGAGLVIGDVLGRLTATVTVVWRTWVADAAILKSVTWKQAKAALSRFRRFPTVSLPATLVNNAGGLIPSLGLGVLFGPQVLGWYALTERALGVPTMLVGQAISQVFMATVSGGVDRNARVAALFRTTVVRLSFVGIIPYVIVAFAGPWLFAFVFGEAWRPAGQYAQVIAIPQFVGFVAWPLIPTLTLLERQDLQLGWDVIRLVAIAATFVCAQAFTWTPLKTVAVLGWAMAVSWTLHLCISHWVIRRLQRTSANENVANANEHSVDSSPVNPDESSR